MSEMTPYLRRVAYYETDQMGIVHHSNYIRWFEEAREDFVRRQGIDYCRIEAAGILMPVVSVDCRYRRAARYGDVVEITACPRRFNGVRLVYDYAVREQNSGALLVTGRSEHCFIDKLSRAPVNLNRRMPDYCAVLSRLVRPENGGTE